MNNDGSENLRTCIVNMYKVVSVLLCYAPLNTIQSKCELNLSTLKGIQPLSYRIY
jgi:hypothetical protein